MKLYRLTLVAPFGTGSQPWPFPCFAEFHCGIKNFKKPKNFIKTLHKYCFNINYKQGGTPHRRKMRNNKDQKTVRIYTTSEEIVNSLSHGLGILFAIIAFFTFFLHRETLGDFKELVAYNLFNVSMFLLYLFSTLYHAVPSLEKKRTLRFYDHLSIYLLIAGTYSPFTLIELKDSYGLQLFSVLWLLALAGIIYKLIVYKRNLLNKYKFVSTLIYIFLGWFGVFMIKPLADNVANEVIILLLSGGLFYTLGTIFYLWKRLPFHHGIWHLFVLMGSINHYFAVYYGVLFNS